jgi:hypothetical protein
MTKCLFSICLLASLLATYGCASELSGSYSGQVPSEMFPSICEKLRAEEGFDAAGPIVVLRATRPIYHTLALRVLHGAGPLTPVEADQDNVRDNRLRASFRKVPVDVPKGSDFCHWVGADKAGRDDLLVEFSGIVEDPFVKGPRRRFGVFVRNSLGGASGAIWYWVSLERVGTRWLVSGVSTLDIADG